jgi:hypothetical protein
MAGNRNLQSLSNLVKAISRLSQNSGEMQETTDYVEATIRTLFPSTNGQTEANRNEIRVVAEHDALNTPDRRYPENAERNGLLSSYVEQQQKYAHITCTPCNRP